MTLKNALVSKTHIAIELFFKAYSSIVESESVSSFPPAMVRVVSNDGTVSVSIIRN